MKPAWCEIHQHHKWCEHNGGVLRSTGYEAPAMNFTPDHNGECLNCDEWADAHGAQEQCPTDPGQALANVEAANRFPSYRCPRCGAVSYNRNDLANRYCGRCKQFESL